MRRTYKDEYATDFIEKDTMPDSHKMASNDIFFQYFLMEERGSLIFSVSQ